MATSIGKLLIRLTKFSSKTSKVIDATQSFNAVGQYYQDLSGWDYAVVQFVSPSALINFYSSNDNGSVDESQLLPAPEVPKNFISVQGINLSTKSDISAINFDGIVQFSTIGKYLLLQGAVFSTASYAYILSASVENQSDAIPALSNGNRIVYASTNVAASVTSFYATSSLLQPILGNPSEYYSFRLLSAPLNTPRACTINNAGVVTVL
jgi:hypothetical protein